MSSFVAIVGSFPSPPTDRIEIGPLTFRFYGLMIAMGVLAAVEMGRRRWAERGGDPDDMIEIAKWAVPAGLVGTRIYHVMTDWKSYRGDWLRAFEIWNGGLGIPGGLVLGVAVGYWYVKRRGWDAATVVTSVIPGVPVAQAIGRLGNWFNQEIFGRPTDVPWAVRIDPEFRPEFPDNETFHPVFLYEGLWNLALAYFLIRMDRAGKLKPFQMIPLWMMGYGVGRFIVEGQRTDFASRIFDIRINHWVSGIAVVVGALWFLWLGRRGETLDRVADNLDGDGLDADELDLDDPDLSDGDRETPDLDDPDLELDGGDGTDSDGDLVEADEG